MITPTLKGSARVICTLLAGMAVQPCFAAVASDLVAPQKRQATVRLAEQLTRPSDRASVPSVTNPFSPPEFENPPAGARIPETHPTPKSDRDILESLSARILSKGTLEHGGKILLSVGPKRMEAGQVLVVADGGKEYELEIVAITRTTFTLRFRNEEITRPVYTSR